MYNFPRHLPPFIITFLYNTPRYPKLHIKQQPIFIKSFRKASPVSWWSLQHHISGDSVRKNLFWFQWFSSGDLSHKITAYIVLQNLWPAQSPTSFWREHYGTLASLNFYHRPLYLRVPFLSAEALISGVLEYSRCLVTLLDYIPLESIYPIPSNSLQHESSWWFPSLKM